MPKFTFTRRVVETYSVEADSIDDAWDRYYDNEATLIDDETLEITVERDQPQTTEGESP